MTYKELIEKLTLIYAQSEHRDTTSMIRLFGIIYAEELKGYQTKELNEMAIKAGLPGKTYSVEINKGRKLAKYVELKEDSKFRNL